MGKREGRGQAREALGRKGEGMLSEVSERIEKRRTRRRVERKSGEMGFGQV